MNILLVSHNIKFLLRRSGRRKCLPLLLHRHLDNCCINIPYPSIFSVLYLIAEFLIYI